MRSQQSSAPDQALSKYVHYIRRLLGPYECEHSPSAQHAIPGALPPSLASQIHLASSQHAYLTATPLRSLRPPSWLPATLRPQRPSNSQALIINYQKRTTRHGSSSSPADALSLSLSAFAFAFLLLRLAPPVRLLSSASIQPASIERTAQNDYQTYDVRLDSIRHPGFELRASRCGMRRCSSPAPPPVKLYAYKHPMYVTRPVPCPSHACHKYCARLELGMPVAGALEPQRVCTTLLVLPSRALRPPHSLASLLVSPRAASLPERTRLARPGSLSPPPRRPGRLARVYMCEHSSQAVHWQLSTLGSSNLSGWVLACVTVYLHLWSSAAPNGARLEYTRTSPSMRSFPRNHHAYACY
ncbi:hypothetical protein L226DRAFT_173617 [Lentinus tigrinus ALCF2SS1-7]|uniref:uncharacterized protein n=1 Tax=Lentinus tigrinus ALCF2SS1-7 TaxID=1328758 RepID=UPI00116602FB|nr:hypothetical protein L226DRAFT_173617 [Lentinus tigrinus ALCF2SS1-7]